MASRLQAKKLDDSPGEPLADSLVNANKSTRAISRNALFSVLSFATSVGTSLIATPTLLRILGPGSYGTWIFLFSVVGYIALIELGIGAATWREIAAAQARNDRQAVDQVMATSKAIFTLAAGLGLLLAGTATFLLGRLGQFDAATLGDAKLALTILGFSQALTFFFMVYTASLVGRGRSDLTIGPGILIAGFTVVGQVLGATQPHPLIAMALATALGSVLQAGITWGVHRRAYPPAPGPAPKANRGSAVRLLRLGRDNAMINALGVISYGADVLIIGLLLPFSSVASYAVATRLVQAIKTLSTKVNDILVSTIADSHASENTQRLRNLFSSSTTLTLAVATPPALLCVLAGDQILDLWLHDVPTGSVRVLQILACALILQLPAHITYTLLSGVGVLRGLKYLSIGQAIVNVSLSVVLTRSMGLVGPATATLVEVSLLATLAPILANRYLQRSLGQYAVTVVRTFAPPILTGSAFLVIADHTELDSFAGLMVMLAALMMVNTALIALFLGTHERRVLIGSLRRTIGGIRRRIDRRSRRSPDSTSS